MANKNYTLYDSDMESIVKLVENEIELLDNFNKITIGICLNTDNKELNADKTLFLNKAIDLKIYIDVFLRGWSFRRIDILDVEIFDEEYKMYNDYAASLQNMLFEKSLNFNDRTSYYG